MTSNINKLLLSYFLGNLYFFLPVLTLFLIDNEIGIEQVVFSQVLYSVVHFIAELPTGVLADRFGHKKSYATGRLIDGVGILSILFFPSISILYFSQALRGLSGALMSGSEDALLHDYCKKGKLSFTKYLGKIKGYGNLGFAVSTFIAGIISGWYAGDAYQLLIFISGISVILSWLLAMSLSEVSEINRGKDKSFEIKEGFKLIKNKPILKTLLIVTSITIVGQYTLIDVYPPHFELNGVHPFFIGASLSMGSFINFLILQNVDKVSSRLGLKSSIVFATLFSAIGYLLLGWASSAYLLVIIFIVMFGIMQTKVVFLSSYANSHIEGPIRATVMSTVNLVKETSKVGYKLLMGFMVANYTVGASLMLYGSILLCGGLISGLLLLRTD